MLPLQNNIPLIIGKSVDEFTRCIHYYSDKDIIAIKFKCCDQYYPCFLCHQETADHEPLVWSKSEYHMKAILCGQCKHELTINEYLKAGNQCLKCSALFNPNCSLHYHLYFENQ